MHNTLTTFSAIKLSTTIKAENEEESDVVIDATISLTNRIAIKADNKLVK
jgi:hypothetical protein